MIKIEIEKQNSFIMKYVLIICVIIMPYCLLNGIIIYIDGLTANNFNDFIGMTGISFVLLILAINFWKYLNIQKYIVFDSENRIINIYYVNYNSKLLQAYSYESITDIKVEKFKEALNNKEGSIDQGVITNSGTSNSTYVVYLKINDGNNIVIGSGTEKRCQNIKQQYLQYLK